LPYEAAAVMPMKKIPLIVCAVTLVSSLCFAEELFPPASPTALADTKIFIGNVESVILADVANKTPARIILAGEKGDRLIFIIIPGTPITGKEGKRVPLGRIKKDDKAIIEYKVIPPKKKIALSIKITGER